MKHLLLTLFTGWLGISVPAANIRLQENAVDKAFPIVSVTENAYLLFDNNDAPVVRTVAEALNSDIKTVTGVQLSVSSTPLAKGCAIIAGTIGSSRYIRQMVENGKLQVNHLQGKWESFSLQLIDAPLQGIERALVICGSDPRGTAYGMFELSRLMGVSPWIWWADVTPRHLSTLYAIGERTDVGEPSVKYRGIFLNDEDWALLPWARNTIDAAIHNIGPNTYRQLAELMLRLRANTLWPAKHAGSMAFWSLQENKNTARNYALVMSTGDSMLRDNLWEWQRFGGNKQNFVYSTNADMIQRYWAQRVGESRGYEAIYDISMRGLEDVPLMGYSSQSEQLAGLTDVISFQRKLLADSLGDPTHIPQIYIPYKEALDLYNAGLKIPDDVTLCWVDDNHGYIRQLPNSQEQRRSGGNGIYYHLSYLGTPMHYLWLSTLSPTFISYELCKAYNNGVQQFWMFNVGDLKPAEMELEFCMELAWNVEKWTPEKASQYSYYWAEKTFGKDYSQTIGNIKNSYYELAASGKPEHINRIHFDNQESEERLQRYRGLKQQVDAIKPQLPSNLRNAFFQLVEYPVKGAANMNIKIIQSARSFEAAAKGNATECETAGEEARKAFKEISDMTAWYNTSMAAGKWNGMMNAAPYGGNVFDEAITAPLTAVKNTNEPVESVAKTLCKGCNYTEHQGNIITINGLGTMGSAVTVSPMDYTRYTFSNYTAAPFTDYQVTLKQGTNVLSIRCLPTFPIHPDYELRIGAKIGEQPIDIQSIATVAMKAKWNTTVVEGFVDVEKEIIVDNDQTINVRIYFLDPGVVLSSIVTEHRGIINDNLTNTLLVNPDFERLSPTSLEGRGVPYGWTMSSTPNGNSYGVNRDAVNLHGQRCCYVLSKPFPSFFELYQIIPAEKLTPGWYKVSCLLWNQNGNNGNCRLFANNSVQYFGRPENYQNILTEGEHARYAGFQGTSTDDAHLRPLSVYIKVNAGENLKVGIRTSNRKNNGSYATGSDPSGWFKVDYFRIERIDETTALSPLYKEQNDIPIYNIQGQHVATGKQKLHTLPHGIYIVNRNKIQK